MARILIVDDNADHVSMLAVLLRDSGHRVEYASNALYALGLAERFQPEVVLLDIGLPFMDGYEAVRRFKRHFRRARVFAITGRGGPEDRDRSLEAGFDEHLLKPVDAATVESLIAAKH